MLTWIAGSMLSLWERQKGFQRGGGGVKRGKRKWVPT